MKYSVYVIRLQSAAMNEPKFARANPEFDHRKPCVYVGSTARAPEQRYEDHLTKKTGSKWVKQFHICLHKTLTEKQPTYSTRKEAEFAVFVLAMHLRNRGYGVWTNVPYVPAFYKETHFWVEDWSDAPNEFAIITAYATTGEIWTDIQNSKADKRLESTLTDRKAWLRRITGYSPSSGHSEPGWAVAIDFATACEIGKHFMQDAIYFVRNGRLYLSYCDARRALIPVGKFGQLVSENMVE